MEKSEGELLEEIENLKDSNQKLTKSLEETELTLKKEIDDLKIDKAEEELILKSQIDELQQELEEQDQSNEECIQFHNEKLEELSAEILKLKGDHALALSKAYLNNYMEEKKFS